MIDKHILNLKKEFTKKISSLQLELKKDIQESLLRHYVPIIQQNGIKFVSWDQGHLFNDGDETYFRLIRPFISFVEYNPKDRYPYEDYIHLDDSYELYKKYYDNQKHSMVSEDVYAKLTYYHDTMSESDLEELFGPEPIKIVISQDGSYLEIPLEFY